MHQSLLKFKFWFPTGRNISWIFIEPFRKEANACLSLLKLVLSASEIVFLDNREMGAPLPAFQNFGYIQMRFVSL
jgi:hypothetical protein